MHRIPSLKQLEAFLAIESTRNLTEAANRLHVSQSALSRTLQMIEDGMHVRLFDRSTRTVTLTRAGATMLPIAKRLVGEFYESFGRFGDYLGGRQGRVVVAGLPSAMVALMPKAIRQLSLTSPEVEVKVMGLVEQHALTAVREGSVDFALATQPASRAGLGFVRLVTDEYVLVCRHDHAFAGRRSVKWSDLERHSFVAMAALSSVRPITDRVFVELGITMDIRYEADNIALMGPMIASGLGVSALPRFALALTDCSELAVVRLIQPRVTRSVGILQRTETPLSPAALRLVQELKAVARQMKPSPRPTVRGAVSD